MIPTLKIFYIFIDIYFCFNKTLIYLTKIGDNISPVDL